MLNFAIIGTGRISASHFEAVKLLGNDLTLVAVCDIMSDNMDEALLRAGITTGVTKYTDYRKLLEKHKPNIVTIATSSGSHAEIGVEVLEAGAHCIIEKPLALSISDADKLIAASETAGRLLAVCHPNRFNRSIVELRKAFDEGRFGNISHMAAHVRWNRTKDYYTQAPWRGTWAADGGCLMNQCIHNADILHWFMGDIDEVFAYTRNVQHPYIESEDLGLALVRGTNGTLGLFEGTVNVYPKNLEETLYVFGEKGTAKLAGPSLKIIEEWNFTDVLDKPETDSHGSGHFHFYKDVVDAIKTGRKPLIDGHEGKRAMELILAIYKSQKTGFPVKLPLDDFATTDMEGIFCNL